MQTVPALRVAIDIHQVPSRVRHARTGALPDGVLDILKIAAGDQELASRSALEAGRTEDVVRAAAIFYIEQVLLCPEADSYRVLGVAPLAPASDVRRNMALLMRWLHPDVMNDNERTVFAARISRAWNDLKTNERRTVYDDARELVASQDATAKKRKDGRSQLRRTRSPLTRFERARLVAGASRSRQASPGGVRRLFLRILAALGK